MVAIAYTDYTDYTDITPLVQPAPAKKLNREPISAKSDPVVDMTTRMLSVPLHHVYALLWRAGVLSVCR